MKNLLTISSLLALVTLASHLAAQTEDWQAVRDLPAETPIAVSLKHERGIKECWLQEATDDDLTCDRDAEQPHRVVYRRADIRKIYRKPEPRLERPSTPPFGVAGAIVGSLPIVLIFQNAAAASVAGGIVGITLIAEHFNHGRLIYRSPSAAANGVTQTRPSSPRNPATGGAPTKRR